MLQARNESVMSVKNNVQRLEMSDELRPPLLAVPQPLVPCFHLRLDALDALLRRVGGKASNKTASQPEHDGGLCRGVNMHQLTESGHRLKSRVGRNKLASLDTTGDSSLRAVPSTPCASRQW